ncbi:Uncharacterised protein [Serratia fonticola]|uniref:Uncharacterized protein n=1 Tax=Serratia fonticola TaxID=47917 RepID=A0A4U9U2Q8_SERFO|nr:Uncharacterised protein [Serratia fonticola]
MPFILRYSGSPSDSNILMLRSEVVYLAPVSVKYILIYLLIAVYVCACQDRRSALFLLHQFTDPQYQTVGNSCPP